MARTGRRGARKRRAGSQRRRGARTAGVASLPRALDRERGRRRARRTHLFEYRRNLLRAHAHRRTPQTHNSVRHKAQRLDAQARACATQPRTSSSISCSCMRSISCGSLGTLRGTSGTLRGTSCSSRAAPVSRGGGLSLPNSAHGARASTGTGTGHLLIGLGLGRGQAGAHHQHQGRRDPCATPAHPPSRSASLQSELLLHCLAVRGQSVKVATAGSSGSWTFVDTARAG